METPFKSQNVLANLISRIQGKPDTVDSKQAFEPHSRILCPGILGSHQNWTDNFH